MPVWILAFALAGSAAAAPFQSSDRGWDWRETLTPHFRILHQSIWLPPGLTMGIEHINFRLRMDLGMFQNFESNERVNVYLYKDLQSYVHGEFSPPPWSNGVAIYDKNAVAIPGMEHTYQMLRVLAHENTHLIFVKYFREAHVDPPSWVNEGLAMLEEADSPDKPETSVWYQNMVAMSPRSWFPMDEFLRINPTRDLHDDKTLVANFYVQAYSVVNFLVRTHSHLQFKEFCDHLRDGQTAAEALRLAYHFRDTAEFERRWRSWLADPIHKRRVDALTAAQRAQSDGVIDRAGQGG
ncbi:MAG TPA: peptidase MA family metallohydrolase, partial [Elusimicrobiota bacterium]|nr:peptidase MA family metallohydrolase [Elusimicrobiota bacterium]